jgi:alkanesulfonate monooxygenase SsuD/methylene tetrahydromethanopterin reductase-like flavin-dependent oxidoreductase (luciferase family)
MVHRIVRSAAMGLLIGRNVDELRSRAERMRKCVPPLAEAEDVLHAAREMGWLVGDPRDVVAQLRSFAEVGVERVIFGHYDLSDVGLLELLAEVLP